MDSALSAALLKEQGNSVAGVFLECWNEPGCRTDQDRKDALKVALKLKIPFKVLDFKRQYLEKVLEQFYREYAAGRTPNPDIWCNKEIKFGLFWDWARRQKFDYMATGHYARILLGKTKFPGAPASPVTYAGSSAPEICLASSIDKDKDQTYFLAFVKEKQLRRVLFPIGHLTKKQVRQEAKKRGLHVWNKKDSTGICFVGHDLNFREFLKRRIQPHPGEAVDRGGKVIGKHEGVEFYTIGQRFSRPYFVIGKDILRNRLIVGKKRELARKEFRVEKWEWISSGTNLQGLALKARIRHRGKLIPCTISGKTVRLARPEFGIAPGQAAVVYQMEGSEPSICLGGGIIAG